MLARRDLLQFASLALSGAVFPRMRGLFDDSQSKGNAVDLPEQYPAYPADLIKTIVTVSHFDLNKLKDLVDPHPHLVKAAWEWGFGDWETPLGAACHMGRRDIAEYLLAKGAPPSLFSWVLFGDLPMVRQIVESQAGIQRVTGPHSISLLAHARTAGKQSQAVMDYLTTLKDADIAEPAPLMDEERKGLCGAYRFGAGPAQRVEVSDDMTPYKNIPMYTWAPQLNWTRPGAMSRPLFHRGDKVFYPAGAPSVAIRFEGPRDAMTMTIQDGKTVFVASRESKA